MSEKVVHEIKVIETEDGFRIEMTGDKEELRKMIFGGRGNSPFGGREWRFGPFGGRHGHGHGPFGHHQGHGPFERPVPPEPNEEQSGEFHFEKRKLREAAGRMRRFGGQWQARWGYDLGPWWDEGMTPTGDPSADV
jgi:hypothetical protein